MPFQPFRYINERFTFFSDLAGVVKHAVIGTVQRYGRIAGLINIDRFKSGTAFKSGIVIYDFDSIGNFDCLNSRISVKRMFSTSLVTNKGRPSGFS